MKLNKVELKVGQLQRLEVKVLLVSHLLPELGGVEGALHIGQTETSCVYQNAATMMLVFAVESWRSFLTAHTSTPRLYRLLQILR